MIQRKQTAFLAFAAIALAQLFIFPVSEFEKGGEKFRMMVYGINELHHTVIIPLALTLISTAAIVVIIFLFKNRKFQMKLCGLVILLLAALTASVFYYIDNSGQLPALSGYASDFRPGIIFPLVALIFVMMANRFIKKDEELVRSADRLR